MMKKRSFWTIAALLGLFAASLAVLWMRGRPAPPLSDSPASTGKQATLLPEGATAPQGNLPGTDPSAVPGFSEIPSGQPSAAPLEIPPELAAKAEPLWGVTIPLAEGEKQTYQLALDGSPIADPRNPSPVYQSSASSFAIPPAPGQSVPHLSGRNQGQFYYEGAIKMRLRFIAEWRGGIWGLDEFQPLNDAARKNLEEIRADKTLSSLRGVVLDSQRKPIPKALVQVNSYLAAVQCDQSGRFQIDRLPLRRVNVMARAWGHADSGQLSALILPEGKTEPLEIVLQPGALVTGTVRDAAGKPVVHALVTAMPTVRRSFGMSSPLPGQASTDVSGRFVHASIAPGTYDFSAAHPRYASALKPEVTVRIASQPQQLDFILDRGFSLPGRVVRKSAKGETGVPKVRILVAGTLAPQKDAALFAFRGAPVQAEALSGDDGAFLLEGLPQKAFLRYLRAQKGGIQKGQSLNIQLSEATEPEPLRIEFPGEGTITGIVREASGKPIEGATVALFQTSDERGNLQQLYNNIAEIPKSATDAEGKFTLTAVAEDGIHILRAEARDYAPAITDPIPGNSREPVEILLGRGGIIAGTVVRATDKVPVAGAKIRASGGFPSMPDKESTSKDDGSFEIANLPEGSWHLNGQAVSTEGLLVIRPLSGIKVRQDQRSEGNEMLAYVAAQISGTILDAGSQQPIPEAMVQLTPPGQKIEGSVSMPYGMSMMSSFAGSSFAGPFLGIGEAMRTDPQGRFTLPGILPGSYGVIANREGFLRGQAERDYTLAEGQKIEGVRILLSSGGTIAGVVLDTAGKPVSQVQVRAEPVQEGNASAVTSGFSPFPWGSSQGVTGSDGRFVLSGLPIGQGKWRASTNIPGQPGGISETVELTAARPSAEVIIRLQRGGGISGTVRDKSGKDIAGAQIIASIAIGPNGFMQAGAATTDASGRYEIQNLQPGKVKVSGQKPQYLPNSIDTEIIEGQTHANVDITLEAARSMDGVLVDLNTKRLAGWRIRSENLNPPSCNRDPRPFTEAVTNAEGRFTIQELPEGASFRLRISSNTSASFQRPGSGYQDLVFRTGTISLAGGELAIVVPTGAKIMGRLLYEGSIHPVTEAKVSLHRESSPGTPPEPEGRQCILEQANLDVGVRQVKPDGSFEIPDLPLSTYNLAIRSETTGQKQINGIVLDTSLVADLKTIYLPRGCTVRGAVAGYQPEVRGSGVWSYTPTGLEVRARRKTGERVSGETVEFNSQSGAFAIMGLPMDTESMALHLHKAHPVRVRIAGLSFDKPLDLGQIKFPAGETVSGRLLGPGGEPAKRANVTIRYDFEGEPFYSYGTTDDSGSFSVTGCARGAAKLSAFAPAQSGNSWIKETYGSANLSEQPLTVNPGGTANLEFRFPAPPEPKP